MVEKFLVPFLLISSGPALAQAAAPSPPVPDESLAAYASTEHSVALTDGRQLHLVCMGKGSPTVLLTAGAGDWAVTWNKVQPALAARTRVCAWDRAGTGFSDASTAPQALANTTTDLEQALDGGGIAGPWLLVGHSIGSYETLLLADRRGKDVAGMVLVDPSFPDMMAATARISPALAKLNASEIAGAIDHFSRCAAELRSGKTTSESDPNGCLRRSRSFPAALTAALAALPDKAARFDTLTSFFEHVDDNAAAVVNPKRNYGAMPLVVLSAGLAPDYSPDTPAEALKGVPLFHAEWRRQHDALAALSTKGEVRVVADASHQIHRLKPQAVIDAIESVLDQARREAAPAAR